MAEFPESPRPARETGSTEEKERLRLLRALLDMVPGIGYLFDLQSRRLLFVSDGIRRLAGLEPDEVLAVTDGDWSGFLAPSEGTEVLDGGSDSRYRNASDADRIVRIRRLRAKDGRILEMETTERIYSRDPDGVPATVLGSAIDVTDRNHADLLRREVEDKFTKVFQEAPVWISITELATGRYLDVNEQAIQDTGFSREEIVGHTSIEIGWISPEDRARLVQEIREQGRVRGMEMGFRAKDGRKVYGIVKGERLEVEGVPCMMTVTTDITARKIAEEGWKATSERLALAVRAGGVGIWDFDVANDRLHWDDQMFRLYGIGATEFQGAYETWTKGLHPDDKARGDFEIQQALRGEKDFDTEFRVVWPDGTIRVLKGIASVIRDADGTPIRMIGTNWDVTESRRVEAELRESEYFFRESQRASRTGSYRLDFATGMWEGSDVLSEVLGLDVKVPRSIEEWLTMVHPDDRERMGAYFREDVVGRRQRFQREYRIVRASDGETRWVHGLGELEIDSQGNLTGMLGTIRDITEQKLVALELDLHRNNLELLVAQRTAQLEAANRELESFSYTVSHDLRAPLRHIDGFVELLSNASPDLDPERGHYLETISSSARKMGVLIDDLLRFSRTSRQELKHQAVDMLQLVEETRASLLEQGSPRRVDWEIGTLPVVEGDAALLRLVWVNLMGNALKYSRDRDPARIRVGSRPTPEGMVFEVEDNGVGFDMRYAGKLFGVFQRLHRQDQFEGTGIGLVTAQRIVVRHGGRIWARSIPGTGATFSFILPVQQGVSS